MAQPVYAAAVAEPSGTAGAFLYLLLRIRATPGTTRTVIVLIGVVLFASCGSGSDGPEPGTSPAAGDKGCAAVVVDPLDPRGNQHLLPGAPAPSYATEPPTSGPHDAGDPVTGLQAGPLSGPVQVTVLERGGIVVQFRPALPAEEREKLADLAGERVVVAPGPSLPSQVIATAWRRRLVCEALDLAAIRKFIGDRTGKGPG